MSDTALDAFKSISNPILRATRVAEFFHRDQKRKITGAPYVTHPLRVACEVMLYEHSTEDMVVAAILHDTVEDTELTLVDVRYLFGARVADYVEELTNQFTKEQHPELNRRERKKRELLRLTGISREAKIIKL